MGHPDPNISMDTQHHAIMLTIGCIAGIMRPMSRAQPELPERVTMSLVTAPSIFSVPTCINKTFRPAFTVRVAVLSGYPTQIKATVAAYTLQKEQARLSFLALRLMWVGLWLVCMGQNICAVSRHNVHDLVLVGLCMWSTQMGGCRPSLEIQNC